MDVTVADAVERLPELIRAVEQGETVVLTQDGRPVAQLNPPPPPAQTEPRRKVVLGSMEGQIKFLPGWDDPMTEEELLGGRF